MLEFCACSCSLIKKYFWAFLPPWAIDTNLPLLLQDRSPSKWEAACAGQSSSHLLLTAGVQLQPHQKADDFGIRSQFQSHSAPGLLEHQMHAVLGCSRLNWETNLSTNWCRMKSKWSKKIWSVRSTATSCTFIVSLGQHAASNKNPAGSHIIMQKTHLSLHFQSSYLWDKGWKGDWSTPQRLKTQKSNKKNPSTHIHCLQLCQSKRSDILSQAPSITNLASKP